jgi:hypothetical protein
MQAKEKQEKPLKWFIPPDELYKWDFILEKQMVEKQAIMMITCLAKILICATVATGACIRSIGFYLPNTQLGNKATRR